MTRGTDHKTGSSPTSRARKHQVRQRRLLSMHEDSITLLKLHKKTTEGMFSFEIFRIVRGL